MLIDDVKSQTIKDLIKEAHNGSMTIESDLEIALQNSENDEELIENWQSGLEGLKNEVEEYWSRLEGIKNAKPINVEKLRALVKENKRLEKEIEELNKGGKQCSK